MRQVLFTGITGQLGIALAKSLTENRISAICFIRRSRDQYKMDLDNFKTLRADIVDKKNIFRYSKELKGKVDTLVHMASPRPISSKRELSTIFKGSINLYDFANEIQCPKYIYFSSIAAAGWVPPGMKCINEDCIPSKKRLGYFGRMKLETEEKLIELSKNNFTKITILRPGNIYGPPKLSFIEVAVDMLKRRKKVLYQRAKKSVMWTPIYIQDVIDCIFTLLKTKSFNNQVYFLTGPEIPTVEYVTQIIAKTINFPIGEMELKFHENMHLAFRKSIDFLRNIRGWPSFPNFVYSNKKIKRDFGLSPKTKLADGIPDTIKWAKREEIL